MRLLGQLASGYLVSRFLSRRRRHSYGRGHRGQSPYMLRRQRGRGRVHATGCCLPIPCGGVVGLTAATTVIIRRLGR